MLSWFLRKYKREACQQLTVELMKFNRRDACWDPRGSFDTKAIENTIACIVDGTISPRTVQDAQSYFRSRKRGN